MIKKQNITPKTKADDMIEITRRLCSPRIQPTILVGKRYFVKEVSELKDGVPVLVVENPDKKGCTMRINANRFIWKITSFEKIKQHQQYVQYRAEEKMFNKMLQEKMSNEDAINVVYVPHVVETFAVRYLVKCADICKDNQYNEYKTVSRKVREIDVNNYYEQIKEIKIEVYKLIQIACNSYEIENKKIIKHLHENIQKELDKAYPNALPECKRKDPLRVYAIYGILLLKLIKRCYLDHDNIVAAGVGEMLYQDNNRLTDIEKCFRVYAGNIDKFNFDAKAILNALDIMKEKLTSVKFKVVNDEKK